LLFLPSFGVLQDFLLLISNGKCKDKKKQVAGKQRQAAS
jgi:hypothetical protein